MSRFAIEENNRGSNTAKRIFKPIQSVRVASLHREEPVPPLVSTQNRESRPLVNSDIVRRVKTDVVQAEPVRFIHNW